jgi:hypothetical protein
MTSVIENTTRQTGAGLVTEDQILDFKTLFHVGTMNPEDKGITYKYSYEGNGLSVSLEPERWIQIAKLGGFPTWKLHNNKNTSFLDFHSLSDQQIEEIKEWGKDLFTEVECYLVESYNEEEEQCFFSFDTRAEAEEEARDFDNSVDEHLISSTTRIKASDLLKERVNIRDNDCALDLVISEWAEAHGFDGIWWEDEYGYYSCPRGVIFKDRVNQWKTEGY